MSLNRTTLLIAVLLTCGLPVGARPAEAQRPEEFDQGISRIAETLAEPLTGKTVAVFEFPNLESQVSNLSRWVSERLTTELVRRLGTRGNVVDRRQVRQRIAEQELMLTDLAPEDVSRVGRLLGADAVVLGSAMVLGNRIVVNARVIDYSQWRVLAADEMSVRGPAELINLASTGFDAPTLTRSPSTPPAVAQPGPTASAPAKSENADPSSPGSVPPPPPAAPVAQKAKVGPVTVELRRCSQQGETVRCELTATSAEDVPFGILMTGFPPDQTVGRTRLVDASGNVHMNVRIGVGREVGVNDGSADLISGVPVAVNVVFSGIPQQAKIPLLELQAVAGPEFRALRFRDVPVERN